MWLRYQVFLYNLQYSYCHCLAMNFVCDLSMIVFLTRLFWQKRGRGSICGYAHAHTLHTGLYLERAGTLNLVTAVNKWGQRRCLTNASSQRLVQSSWSKAWERPEPRSCANSWRTMEERWKKHSPRAPPTS